MKNIIILFLLIVIYGCTQDKQPIKGETYWQKEMNADFKDATKSPLKDADRKYFRGLDFFKYDSMYIVSAKFTRTPNEKPFKMKTTTNRLPNYVKYGDVEFGLNGNSHILSIYRNLDLVVKEGFENYLFLPFLDNTNGEESYGGGRYVEVEFPEGNEIIIDFNQAYNPYCAYNEKYSCPIVPRSNYVDEDIRAGVKAFGKH